MLSLQLFLNGKTLLDTASWAGNFKREWSSDCTRKDSCKINVAFTWQHLIYALVQDTLENEQYGAGTCNKRRYPQVCGNSGQHLAKTILTNFHRGTISASVNNGARLANRSAHQFFLSILTFIGSVNDADNGFQSVCSAGM